MAAGVLMAAHEMGISVPTQLSVVGFDDTYIAHIVWPRLTTMHQPSYDLAYATGLALPGAEDAEDTEAARLGVQARVPRIRRGPLRRAT